MVDDEVFAFSSPAHVHDECLQIFHWDKSRCVRIILRPNHGEFSQVVRLNSQFELVCLSNECVDNDRDEKIDEHLAN